MPNEENEAGKRLISFLLSPSSYPHTPPNVKHVQTHASDVFIASPYVYKVKKPVDFGFLDFTSLEKRRHYCFREVELNRRLCESAYLGVEEIRLGKGGYSFGGAGETAEYAVKMRELPEDRFLNRMLAAGDAADEDFTGLAAKLVRFYGERTPGGEVLANGDPGKIRLNIDDNLSHAREHAGLTVTPRAFEALKLYNDLFFSLKSGLLRKRRDEGFVKDCHGDLRLEHINFGSPEICIYDCIEFNDRLRYIDVASDIGFLAMDLDYNGRYEIARSLVSRLSTALGDPSMTGVLDFYKCYRACVRAKVEDLRSGGSGLPRSEKDLSLERARGYYRLALRYALLGSDPSVIVTFGIIGTGKSTLAAGLSEELSCPVISSDIVRKEITGTGLTERRREGYAEGIYSEDVTRRTYDELISRGSAALASHNAVILDASFSRRASRGKLLERAAKEAFRVVFVRTTAPEDVTEERLIKRESEGTSVSDAGAGMLRRFKSGFEEPEELPRALYFEADTSRPEDDVLASVLTEIITAGLKDRRRG